MRREVIAVVGVVVASLVAGCGSGSDSGSPDTAASSLDAGASDQSLTTTATEAGSSSPYFARMPDLCPRFPDDALAKVGFTPSPGYKTRSPDTPVSKLLHTCEISYDNPNGEGTAYTLSVGVTSEPFHEVIAQDGIRISNENVVLGPNRAYLYTRDGRENTCYLSWGTFYGTALWLLHSGYSSTGDNVDLCSKLEEFGNALYQYMPTKPSEMG